MALSNMSPRERTIMIILGVIIVAAVIGIGLLAAKLISDDGATGGDEEVGVLPSATLEGVVAGGTATLVPPPSLSDEAAQATPPPVSAQAAVVNRVSSLTPGLPAILSNQPLYAGHRYSLEVTAQDGSQVAVKGSWSQAASNAQGSVQIQPAQVLEGRTPLAVELESPVPNPGSWSVSASVGSADLLGQTPALVITIWDITGSQ